MIPPVECASTVAPLSSLSSSILAGERGGGSLVWLRIVALGRVACCQRYAQAPSGWSGHAVPCEGFPNANGLKKYLGNLAVGDTHDTAALGSALAILLPFDRGDRTGSLPFRSQREGGTFARMVRGHAREGGRLLHRTMDEVPLDSLEQQLPTHERRELG